MMSKNSSRTKIVPTKVTDWVAPSFDDFFGNTNILSSTLLVKSSGEANQHQKRKDHSSVPESSKNKVLARIKGKSSSIDHICDHSKQNQSQSQNEPWVDKYKPGTQNELAVHKKKIEEVESWLKAQIFQRQPKQGGSVLVLTGPPGCGKSATIQILAKELHVQVQEWTNPISLDFRKEDFKDAFNYESSFQMLPSQAQTALFQDFLLRATKYNKLQMLGESTEADDKLILIEDMPNQFYRDRDSLHEILRRFVRTSRCPLVFIISDSLSGDSNQKLLFPKEIQEELCISSISFNPVAPTMMMKVLNRIATAEASMNGEKFAVPDKTSLELICKGCSGDIRSAINSLQFSSLKEYSSENKLWSRKKGKSTLKSNTEASRTKKKKKADKTLENQEIQAIGGKDASIFLFHALGKILYCKREPLSDSEFPRLPSHLSEYERDTLLVQPEDIVEKSHMPGDLFNLYLHQNYVDFFTDIDDLVRASEYLSAADFLCSNWNSRLTLREYSASVATRGVIHSNTARAFAHCQGGMGFRPFHKPQWFLINKKYQENCLAAKSLFSSFCLPPLCLQTQLLPFLAMLTNPMRNQAQIAFIQDVGRLPLKRHFGGLKLETLTDKDLGMPGFENIDEGDLSAMQPLEVLVQLEKKQINETEPDEFPLTSSQASGSELPGSQPQPITAQAILEEDELKIDEYDSD
ncbi:cell cycle checkpoint protein RAD17 isoform X1 [Mauremys reevesii]|uniref:cell cycle checkpoint protein RAD17 isoform X1 n=1 Tax=Mauremys reevesii TaxID=260615 RepID=UPI00193F823D|nr:cell cycle checkpoint protein RAD17 isoform X1 [Mauremys reevesii]XP_039401055.1 cell cycle checkpoint protein RAD17 isoform X1 [Mauremys reevesii]XP_039401057.1 cell cycle checkpoint protein RAD17 isoform X1 [Mauremys reevesii]